MHCGILPCRWYLVSLGVKQDTVPAEVDKARLANWPEGMEVNVRQVS